MRIIGEIDHPVLKITAFKSNNRLSLKFESGLYEQTYKFREGEGPENFADLEQLVDEAFLQGVMDNLQRMNRLKNAALSRNSATGGEEEFEKIY